MKQNFLLFLIFFLMFYLIADPSHALNAARDGLGLWLNTLMPTLLPFMILSGLLLQTGVIEKLLTPLSFFWKWVFGLTPWGAYAFLLGMLCGYPMGAKLTGELYGTGKITKREAHYLLTFCNNASPVFLSAYLVLTILARPDLLFPTFAIIYLSNSLCALGFRLYYRPMHHFLPCMVIKKETSSVSSSGNWIDVSIMNGFETITKLGGYILLFSLLNAAIKNLWTAENLLQDIILSLTEISTGLNHLKSASLPFPLKYALAAAASSFGGVCILAQTRSVILEQGLSLLPYLAGKLLNLVLTFLIALAYSLACN